MSVDDMRDEYDFSAAVPNPYPARLKKPITIRLDAETVDYFKALATDTGVPYQTLMNLYLYDCARRRLRPSISWLGGKRPGLKAKIPATKGRGGEGGE